MKLKLDENMPEAMVTLLAEAGHDAITTREESLGGCDDPHILEVATAEERVLVTFDVGFGDVRAYPPGQHAGVVVFRLDDQRWSAFEGPARMLIASGVLDELPGGPAIVDRARFRVRRP